MNILKYFKRWFRRKYIETPGERVLFRENSDFEKRIEERKAEPVSNRKTQFPKFENLDHLN